MNETMVTVVGNVVSAIDKSRSPDGTVRATFRVGNTERRFDRATGGWVDGERLYVSVTCWRRLAENAVASLVKGDPVVVTGRLYTRNYEQDGNRRSVIQMDAHAVAADLSRCTVTITRNRPLPTGQAGEQGMAATGSSTSADEATSEQVTSPVSGYGAAATAATMPAFADDAVGPDPEDGRLLSVVPGVRP